MLFPLVDSSKSHQPSFFHLSIGYRKQAQTCSSILTLYKLGLPCSSEEREPCEVQSYYEIVQDRWFVVH